jgi:D-alanyl-D-alanine dipeptidase
VRICCASILKAPAGICCAGVFVFTLAFSSMASADEDLTRAIPSTCGQVVLVTSADWDASAAELRCYERADARAPWRQIGGPITVRTGRRGLAWGIGQHTATRGEGQKSEGDQRAPAGVFPLTAVFASRAAPIGLRMPFIRITAETEAIDDPKSRYYNRIIQRSQVPRPDWHSSEKMLAIPDYALGIAIGHNPRATPGAGSCIFLHLWLGRRLGTSGCTILRPGDLELLIRWLDAARHPVLIQVPQALAPHL